MKITIGFPVMNLHKLTIECLRLIEKNTHTVDELIIIDNGSDQALSAFNGFKSLPSAFLNKIRIIRNTRNIGVRDGINQIWENAKNEYILLMHNDVLILEKDWDLKVKKAFRNNAKAGIIGCYGSKGIGTSNIYQTPYEMNQLARNGNVSGSSMDRSVHGFRPLSNKFENVAVFDGFALIVKKVLLDKIEGLDKKILKIHHFYDMYICVESLKNGYENIVIPLDFFHKGGASDVSQDWTKGTGKTKQEIHSEAHPLFYEYGKGILPIMISDIYNEEDRIIGYQLFMDRKLIKEKMYE